MLFERPRIILVKAESIRARKYAKNKNVECFHGLVVARNRLFYFLTRVLWKTLRMRSASTKSTKPCGRIHFDEKQYNFGCNFKLTSIGIVKVFGTLGIVIVECFQLQNVGAVIFLSAHSQMIAQHLQSIFIDSEFLNHFAATLLFQLLNWAVELTPSFWKIRWQVTHW